MKITITLLSLAAIGFLVLVIGCKERGIQADVDAAIAQGQYNFIALLDPEGKWTYPQVTGIPDWYFQTTGIRIQQTTPETREAHVIYMKTYNDALYQTLKAQGKFHLIEENIARVKENLAKQKQ
jgi:hypothetical protein